MKSGIQFFKFIGIVALVFFAPRVILNGGTDFTTLKNKFFANANNQNDGSSKNAQNVNGLVIPIKVEQQGEIDLPVPEEVKPVKATPLKDVLWFGYVPNDIVQRWPYVIAANPELHLQAYRTPFYTGTAKEDLAGVVSYYFDAENTLQKIIIKAKTGDFRPLVIWLEKYYGFVQRKTQSPVVYVYEQPNTFAKKNGSYLWIRPNHAFAEGYDYGWFDITLELNHPQ